MKIKTLAAALLTSSLAVPVFATDTIMFDPDGAGTDVAVEILTLDWAVGSSLSDQSIPTAEGDTFNTYTHGSLAGYNDADGSVFAQNLNNDVGPYGYEITFISGFTETITSFSATDPIDTGMDSVGGNDIYTFSSTILLADAASQDVNFFTVYYDDTMNSNNLTGLGFNDGTMILEANVTFVDGSFTTDWTFEDINGDGEFDPLVDMIIATSLLDSTTPDEWGGQLTVDGAGATVLEADVTSQDDLFFLDDISSLMTDLFFNSSNVVPFDQSNPSQSFDDGAGGTLSLANGLLEIGNLNGAAGPDILFQTDANNAFVKTVPVPEPNSIFIFAIGLLALGFASRRRLASVLTA